MNIKMTLAVLALALVGAVGCRKDPVEALSNDERRIYITNRDSSVAFSSYKTFSMAEDVVVVDGSNGNRQLTAADEAFMQAIVAQMQSRGYTLVAKSASPDLGVQISRIIRTSTGVMSVPDYYGYWDPFFWGSGFGSGFGGWGAPTFWYTTTYQVREGMLAVDLVDLKNASTNNNLRIIWNGLVRGPGLSSTTAAPEQAAQLFALSPYLQTN